MTARDSGESGIEVSVEQIFSAGGGPVPARLVHEILGGVEPTTRDELRYWCVSKIGPGFGWTSLWPAQLVTARASLSERDPYIWAAGRTSGPIAPVSPKAVAAWTRHVNDDLTEILACFKSCEPYPRFYKAAARRYHRGVLSTAKDFV